jgi:hypothetical protein
MGEIFPVFKLGFSGMSVNGVKATMNNCASGYPMQPIQPSREEVKKMLCPAARREPVEPR